MTVSGVLYGGGGGGGQGPIELVNLLYTQGRPKRGSNCEVTESTRNNRGASCTIVNYFFFLKGT